MTDDPSIIALGSLTALMLTTGLLIGVRRGWGYGSWMVWGWATRGIALVSVAVDSIVISAADPTGVVSRLFPDATGAEAAELMLAYDMTLAREALVTMALAILIDVTVTFLTVRWLRAVTVSIATVVMLLSAVNAALFIGALFVQS